MQISNVVVREGRVPGAQGLENYHGGIPHGQRRRGDEAAGSARRDGNGVAAWVREQHALWRGCRLVSL